MQRMQTAVMANRRETKRVCLFQRRQQKSAKPYAAKSAKRCTGAPLAALIPTNRHRYQVCSATSLRQLITTSVLQASPRFLSCILDTCQPCGGMKCMKLNESMAGTLPCARLLSHHVSLVTSVSMQQKWPYMFPKIMENSWPYMF